MIVKLLSEHHLEFLSFKGDCRGSSESTHVKMSHCWKSHVTAHISFIFLMVNLFRNYKLTKCSVYVLCSFKAPFTREGTFIQYRARELCGMLILC